MGLVGCPFHLLHPTLLSLVSLFLVHFLLSELFLMFFSFVFLSNVSNFFTIIPNIPDQTFYHPIYTTSLLYISLVILLYETLYGLLFLLVLTPLHTFLQTFLPGLLHSLSSPLVPKCLLLLYIPFIHFILDTTQKSPLEALSRTVWTLGKLVFSGRMISWFGSCYIW